MALSDSQFECEILIIGAGIVGASAAYALAPHARVLLAERERSPGITRPDVQPPYSWRRMETNPFGHLRGPAADFSNAQILGSLRPPC
jgi:glycine/D-amino acid oxidase-like deaminating enzyme